MLDYYAGLVSILRTARPCHNRCFQWLWSFAPSVPILCATTEMILLKHCQPSKLNNRGYQAANEFVPKQQRRCDLEHPHYEEPQASPENKRREHPVTEERRKSGGIVLNKSSLVENESYIYNFHIVTQIMLPYQSNLLMAPQALLHKNQT